MQYRAELPVPAGFTTTTRTLVRDHRQDRQKYPGSNPGPKPHSDGLDPESRLRWYHLTMLSGIERSVMTIAHRNGMLLAEGQQYLEQLKESNDQSMELLARHWFGKEADVRPQHQHHHSHHQPPVGATADRPSFLPPPQLTAHVDSVTATHQAMPPPGFMDGHVRPDILETLPPVLQQRAHLASAGAFSKEASRQEGYKLPDMMIPLALLCGTATKIGAGVPVRGEQAGVVIRTPAVHSPLRPTHVSPITDDNNSNTVVQHRQDYGDAMPPPQVVEEDSENSPPQTTYAPHQHYDHHLQLHPSESASSTIPLAAPLVHHSDHSPLTSPQSPTTHKSNTGGYSVAGGDRNKQQPHEHPAREPTTHPAREPTTHRAREPTTHRGGRGGGARRHGRRHRSKKAEGVPQTPQ